MHWLRAEAEPCWLCGCRTVRVTPLGTDRSGALYWALPSLAPLPATAAVTAARAAAATDAAAAPVSPTPAAQPAAAASGKRDIRQFFVKGPAPSASAPAVPVVAPAAAAPAAAVTGAEAGSDAAVAAAEAPAGIAANVLAVQWEAEDGSEAWGFFTLPQLADVADALNPAGLAEGALRRALVGAFGATAKPRQPPPELVAATAAAKAAAAAAAETPAAADEWMDAGEHAAEPEAPGAEAEMLEAGATPGSAERSLGSAGDSGVRNTGGESGGGNGGSVEDPSPELQSDVATGAEGTCVAVLAKTGKAKAAVDANEAPSKRARGSRFTAAPQLA